VRVPSQEGLSPAPQQRLRRRRRGDEGEEALLLASARELFGDVQHVGGAGGVGSMEQLGAIAALAHLLLRRGEGVCAGAEDQRRRCAQKDPQVQGETARGRRATGCR
jgi:hypothetical protein